MKSVVREKPTLQAFFIVSYLRNLPQGWILTESPGGAGNPLPTGGMGNRGGCML
jgi:hypothetical protein